MHAILQDLKHAWHVLARNPGFSAIAIVVLALGIGANTAMFSVVDAVVLRPLPFRNPSGLLSIDNVSPLNIAPGSKPIMLWRKWADGTKTLEDVSVYITGELNWAGRGEPARVSAAEVSGNFFQLLGIRPIQGRTFRSGEESQVTARVALLSYRFWKTRYGSAPQMTGQIVQLNGKPFTVIGIMPPGFDFPGASEIWVPFPLALTAEMFGGPGFALNTLARVRPGATIAQAIAELQVIARRELPAGMPPSEYPVQVTPLHQELVRNIRPALLLLFGAVGFVLLIACADVANLLLSRNVARAREFAVRAALGASRVRLIRQLLTESILLALPGAALGILLGWWAMDLARVLIPPYTPLVARIRMNGWVLLFTLGAAVVTGIVAGLVPALRSSRLDLTEALKEGGVGSRAGGTPGLRRLRSAFGIAEIALALVLLMGAGLLIKSFARLTSVNPGFRTDHLLTAQVTLLGPRYKTEASRWEFYDQALRRARALPGVRGAAFVSGLPMSGHILMEALEIEGRRQPSGVTPENGPMAIDMEVSRGYFRVMGIPLIQGRYFSAEDSKAKGSVAIVSRAMAQRFWPNKNPIGKRFRFEGPNHGWIEVVGVVGDTRMLLDVEPMPEMYLPMQRAWATGAFLLVRTSVKPLNIAAGLRDVIHSVDPEEPVSAFSTMNQVIAKSVASPRFRTVLLGIFAGLALALAVAGIYGIISYSVSERNHEMGIRIALGAQRGDVMKLVVKQGMTLALVGIAIGIAASFALTRFLTSMLYGVRPVDPITLLIVSLVLAGVAFLACYIPARRATKIDPVVALRYE